MRNKLFVNIAFILFAVAIVFFVIRPKYEGVQRINEEVVQYQEALQTANEAQQLLGNIEQRIESIDPTDVRALEAYVPESIDSLSVSRDIKIIAETEGMVVSGISSADLVAPTTQSEQPQLDAGPAFEGSPDREQHSTATAAVADMQSQQFTATLIGTYEEMKQTLEAIARNHYPLRVVSLTFSTEGGEATAQRYTLVLETYALPSHES